MVRQLRLTLFFDTLVPDVIERTISGRLKQIRLRGALGRKRFPPPPQLEHHILHNLLGNRPRPDNRLGRPDKGRVPGAENRIERSLIACSKPFG